MKKLFTLLVAALFAAGTIAKPVDPAKAKLIGQAFLTSKANVSLGKTLSLSLAYTSSSSIANGNGAGLGKSTEANYFYVFNVNQSHGFVIISADDQVIPILGYSDEKGFDPANIPPNVAKWLEGYKTEIRYVVNNHIPATEAISSQWEELNNSQSLVLGKKAGVGPLIATKWDQSPYYNALCPNDAQANERAVTGCVATAMAQVMKFWKYPKTGTGFHAYNHDKYGTLSASFGSTTYDWNNMPNQVTSANNPVATLMYQCGVSVDMNYGIASTGGSGAYVISDASPVTNCTEYALKTYFGYKSSLKGVLRSNYTDPQWMTLVKGELDAGRPIIYAGFGSGGGHCFVCDGYDNSNFLHFNWGWSGYYDGFFASNALNPGGVGTGGGSGGFNNNHQAVIGIEAPSGTLAYNLEMDNDVSISSPTINYGNSFSVDADVLNSGSGAFSGDYTAAIFDQNGLLVTYTDTLLNQTLGAGVSTSITLPHPGSFTILPGSYTIKVFYRIAGGSWKQIKSNNINYLDFVNMQVVFANYIEAFTSIVASPTTFLKGDSASVVFNVANTSASTFYGFYKVSLFNLDGTFAQNIGNLLDESVIGLQAGFSYSAPYLKVKADSITVAPGTYLMAVMFYPQNAPNWYLAGSSYITNPIKVNVALPAPPADKYEPNDTTTTASSLPVAFSNNIATVTTQGANCHKGTDYDYYKLVLPPGYAYKITGKVNDASSATPSPYTLDALVSYAVGTNALSEAFDDAIADTIKVNSGGGTVYFKVSPYFTGNTGTYQLDLKVTRSVPASGKDITAFTVADISGTSTINSVNATVTLKVKSTASLTSLAPVISVSTGATINPASGVARDFTAPLTYTVTAEDNTTKNWTVTITKEFPTALEEISGAGIRIYPNPAKEQVQVDLSQYSIPVKEIFITDLQGRVLQTQAVSKNDPQTVNTSLLKEGVYFVQLATDAGMVTQKLTITK